jgi:hypothetical protein
MSAEWSGLNAGEVDLIDSLHLIVLDDWRIGGGYMINCGEQHMRSNKVIPGK